MITRESFQSLSKRNIDQAEKKGGKRNKRMDEVEKKGLKNEMGNWIDEKRTNCSCEKK